MESGAGVSTTVQHGVGSEVTEVKEGKAVIRFDKKLNIFYNAPQEVNRDISIVGIQSHLIKEGKTGAIILEAMAASGIRSIRFALEIEGIKKVIANDYSEQCIKSIQENSKLNGTENIVLDSFNDANSAMRTTKGFVIDLDPYGSPAKFIDTAVQQVEDNGLFVLTATDMAGLAGGNAAESCFAKYGGMPLKIRSCHEMALRILTHAVQSSANRYGRVALPLLSLKIDFYVRIFFKIIHSPEKAKESAINTALVFHCVGCKTNTFQPLATRKSPTQFGFGRGPPVSEKCSNCESIHHVGGPIWIGSLHDKEFLAEMERTLKDKYSYVNTYNRIEGLIRLVAEEVNVPLFYDIAELCSVLKVSTIPLVKIRSAILNLGYEVSLSHIAPNSIKTNCPNEVLWDILRVWKSTNEGRPLQITDGPGFIIMKKPPKTEISFEVHPEANSVSKENNLTRYQMNPTKYWGPGVRDAFKGEQKAEHSKRSANQGKRSRKDREKYHKDHDVTNDSDTSIGPESKTPKTDVHLKGQH